MNWNLIKEKYPKAYKEGQDWWVAHAEIYEPAFLFNIGNRFLYDFFDEQGVVVEVVFAYNNTDEIYWFEYYIYKNGVLQFCSMDEPDYEEPYKTITRTEAEEQAFIKAFEILEDKL